MHEDELQMVVDMVEDNMQKAIKHLEVELSHVRAAQTFPSSMGLK